MSDTKSADTSTAQFSSTVFPNADEMALWESLSPEEQRAVILLDEEMGYRSGSSPTETVDQRLKRVRSVAL